MLGEMVLVHRYETHYDTRIAIVSSEKCDVSLRRLTVIMLLAYRAYCSRRTNAYKAYPLCCDASEEASARHLGFRTVVVESGREQTDEGATPRHEHPRISQCTRRVGIVRYRTGATGARP